MSHGKNVNKTYEAEKIFHIHDTYIDLTKDVAIARIVARVEGDWVETSGSARRHPDDKANPRVAALLAYSRAVENLANKLDKRAQGAVKHAEDVIETKAKQKNKKTNLVKKGNDILDNPIKHMGYVTINTVTSHPSYPRPRKK